MSRQDCNPHHFVGEDASAPEIVTRVHLLGQPRGRALVVLDSCHTKSHVLGELNAYHDLVSTGLYIVSIRGVMQFAAAHPEFVLEQPAWPFNESELSENVTHWPGAWLRRT
jgi:cephalosporin hydroxylase